MDLPPAFSTLCTATTRGLVSKIRGGRGRHLQDAVFADEGPSVGRATGIEQVLGWAGWKWASGEHQHGGIGPVTSGGPARFDVSSDRVDVIVGALGRDECRLVHPPPAGCSLPCGRPRRRASGDRPATRGHAVHLPWPLASARSGRHLLETLVPGPGVNSPPPRRKVSGDPWL
jgi:hypothetical protein